MLLDIFLSSVLNFHSLPWKNGPQILSHAISGIVIIGYCFMIGRIISIMIRLEFSRLDKIERIHVNTKYKNWLFLRVPIKLAASVLSRFVPEYILIGDTLVCILLVVFNGSGKLQIIPIMAFKLIIILALFQKPLKEKIDQWMLTINEVFFFLILGAYLAVDILNKGENSSISKKQMYNKVGLTTVILFILLMAFNMIISGISLFLGLRELCQKKSKSNKKSGLQSVIEKRQRLAIEQ